MTTNDGLVNNQILHRDSRKTLQEQLVDLLAERISSGELAAGTKLPSVREMAGEFGVSRETANLAIGSLKEMNLVEILPSRGAYVLEITKERSYRKKIDNGTFGFILDLGDYPEETDDYHLVYDSLLRNLDSRLNSYGHHLMTSYIGYSGEAGKARLRGMLPKVDGIFVAGLWNKNLATKLASLEIPVVSLLANIDEENIDDFGLDNYRTFRNITGELLESGHRKIVYMGGPAGFYQQDRRIAGCRRALEDSEDPEPVFHTVLASGWEMEKCERTFLEYLDKNEGRPDGVVCVNDIAAVGVLSACRRKGVEVPGDLSLIGAKNTILSAGSSPRLSSIEYHYDEIAALAVERMMKKIKSGPLPPVRMEIVGTLTRRESFLPRRAEEN